MSTPTPPAPQPGPSYNTADTKKRGDGLGFKIATAVLAVTTVGFAIWGFNANKNYNDLKAQTDAQISQLEQQVEAVEADESKVSTADKKKIAAAQARFEEVKGNLKIEAKHLKGDDQQLNKLRQEYESTKAAAAKDESSLETQLKAAEAEAALAKHCSAVLASGLLRIYEDVPGIVTYDEVAAQLQKASVQCKGVVQVSTPSK